MLALGGLVTGCASPAAAGTAAVALGYFPNVTHAPALVADASGQFAKRLAAVGATPAIKSFRAGPEVLQALLSGSVDVAYLGPSPTITAYVQSRTTAVRVIAGSTSGGAALVVRPEIAAAGELRGRRLATPQLGNTQDVALRYWLRSQGLSATKDGAGDVSILPQANAAAVQAFRTGAIDGGWLPEPYASALVTAGGRVLVDERSRWPGGAFVTTQVVARTEFLQRRPDAARAVLEAHLDALDLIAADAGRARTLVSSQIKAITAQAQNAATLDRAWQHLAFTPDPLAATLRASADHAAAVGLLLKPPSDNFAGLWSLDLVDDALAARGRARVVA
ncbi:MAG: ABC transporter substrate-binding protein [Micropruina sp.]|nr:MAG: ABC transporter substrate-binding protein [Micropruina sp.]